MTAFINSGDDVLQQLSVMDLFANVAIISAVAAQFVGEVGLTQRVYDLMQKCKDAPDGGFLYPGKKLLPVLIILKVRLLVLVTVF